MAWQCSGRTNLELIHNLFSAKLITSPLVRDAMIKVDRAHYTPTRTHAYTDSPQPIGHDATISAPHMHAHAAESLLPFLKPGSRVLDIGSGSGYLTHVFAELVFPSTADVEGNGGKGNEKPGKVIGLEHIQALRDLGERNMRKSEDGVRFLEEGKVVFVKGDGRLGYSDPDGDESEGGVNKGWDAIHVGAAAVKVHEELVEQLRSPGRIFIPVSDSNGDQYIWVIDKNEKGHVQRKKMYGVRYVPLTDAPAED